MDWDENFSWKLSIYDTYDSHCGIMHSGGIIWEKRQSITTKQG